MRACIVQKSRGEEGKCSSRTWWVGKLIPAEQGQANSSQETVTAAVTNLNFTGCCLFLCACVYVNSNIAISIKKNTSYLQVREIADMGVEVSSALGVETSDSVTGDSLLPTSNTST